MTDDVSGGLGWFPTDLLGHPVPANKGQRARPQHAPTAENLEKAILLYATGRTDKEVAAALGITTPTLRKHYFSSPELKRIRLSARMVVEGQALYALAKQVKEGKVAAIEKMLKLLDKSALGKVETQVLKDHAACCVAEAIASGDEAEQIKAAFGQALGD